MCVPLYDCKCVCAHIYMYVYPNIDTYKYRTSPNACTMNTSSSHFPTSKHEATTGGTEHGVRVAHAMMEHPRDGQAQAVQGPSQVAEDSVVLVLPHCVVRLTVDMLSTRICWDTLSIQEMFSPSKAPKSQPPWAAASSAPQLVETHPPRIWPMSPRLRWRCAATCNP